MNTYYQCFLFMGESTVESMHTCKYALLTSDHVPDKISLLLSMKGIHLIEGGPVVPPPNTTFNVTELLIHFNKDKLCVYCDSINRDFVKALLSGRRGPRCRVYSRSLKNMPSYKGAAARVMGAERLAAVRPLLMTTPKIFLTRKDVRLTLLSLAIENGRTDLFDLLLMSGADVNEGESLGKTPLHRACEAADPKSRLFFARSLVGAGAVVDTVSAGGSSPLSRAITGGDIEVTRLLLAGGANANRFTGDLLQSPLLQLAAESKYCDSLTATMVELLLEYGADPSLRNNRGNPPLLHLSHNKLQTLRVFARRKGVLDLSSTCGDTVLFLAVQSRSFAMVDIILDLKPDPNAIGNKRAFRYAMSASDEWYTDVVRSMLKQGFGTEMIDDTPYFFGAVQKGFARVVELLLDEHCTLLNRCRISSPETPLETALRFRQDTLVQTLLDRGAIVRHQFFSFASIKWVEKLFANMEKSHRRWRLDTSEKLDSRWLLSAISNPNRGVLQFLLDRGVDPNDGTVLKEMVWPSVYNFELLTKFGARWALRDLLRFNRFPVIPTLLNHSPTKLTPLDVEKYLSCAYVDYEVALFFVKLAALNPGVDFVGEYCAREGRELQRWSDLKPNGSTLMNFKLECEAETMRMNEEIPDSKVTYNDILKRSVDEIVCFARHGAVVEGMESRFIYVKFPIYADLLHTRFKKAVDLKVLREKAMPTLKFLFSGFTRQFPEELMEIIMKYLSHSDLMKLPKCLTKK